MRSHAWDRAYSLCYRCRFTDAAGLYYDVVKALQGDDVIQLLHEVHLERAADAAVLQSNERIVLLPHDTALLYHVGIDVYFADVIDNHSKLDALFILQNTVK